MASFDVDINGVVSQARPEFPRVLFAPWLGLGAVCIENRVSLLWFETHDADVFRPESLHPRDGSLNFGHGKIPRFPIDAFFRPEMQASAEQRA